MLKSHSNTLATWLGNTPKFSFGIIIWQNMTIGKWCSADCVNCFQKNVKQWAQKERQTESEREWTKDCSVVISNFSVHFALTSGHKKFLNQKKTAFESALTGNCTSASCAQNVNIQVSRWPSYHKKVLPPFDSNNEQSSCLGSSFLFPSVWPQ